MRIDVTDVAPLREREANICRLLVAHSTGRPSHEDPLKYRRSAGLDQRYDEMTMSIYAAL